MGSTQSPHFLRGHEEPADVQSIFNLNCSAFATEGEAVLVDRPRGSGAEILSVIAERNGEVAGHAFLTPVIIESETGSK